MPDEQDKKINYKILTAEEILKEAEVPAKAIEHREEKIEVPVTEKVETKIETLPAEKIKEGVEVIETEKKEAGVLYLEEHKEEPIELEPTIPQPIPELEKEVEIKGPESIITQSIEKSKEQVWVEKQSLEQQEPEKLEEIVYLKPQQEKPTEEIKEPAEMKEKPKIKFNLNYVLISGTLIIILLLIFFFKPYGKIKAFLQSKEKQPSEKIIPATTQIAFPTTSPNQETVVSFPTITVSTPTQETTTQVTFPTITVSNDAQEVTSPITSPTITVSTPTKIINEVTTETPSISQEKKTTSLPTKDLNLPGEMITLQRKDFESFLARQQSFGTKINVKLLDNEQRLSVDFLFDYFIKAKNNQELRDGLTGNYGFIIYYGYVRKYPILVFEIKDRNKVLKFNQNWEKTTMKNDLQTLFLGSQPPKTNNNFQTKNFNNFSYRILNFGDNYKIIWALTSNYLIYTTTETGFKEVISYLQ